MRRSQYRNLMSTFFNQRDPLTVLSRIETMLSNGVYNRHLIPADYLKETETESLETVLLRHAIEIRAKEKMDSHRDLLEIATLELRNRGVLPRKESYFHDDLTYTGLCVARKFQSQLEKLVSSLPEAHR